MKGYYVIPKAGEPIEITGRNARNRAIAKAMTIFEEMSDSDVLIQQFDDANSDGYMANLECLQMSDILNSSN